MQQIVDETIAGFWREIDVRAAADSLEQAKVALRALGKYAPIDLVRQLYDARREPALGGEIHDVTLMFSDIEGFTSISERLVAQPTHSASRKVAAAILNVFSIFIGTDPCR